MNIVPRVCLAELEGIEGIPEDSLGGAGWLVFERSASGLLAISPCWVELTIAQRLIVLKKILEQGANGKGRSTIRWCFSGVRLDASEIRSSLADWETTDFPILSLIDVESVNDRATTVGFDAVSGFEIAVTSKKEQTHPAMVLAAHAALHLLDGSKLKAGDTVRSGGHRAVVVNQVDDDYHTLNLIMLDLSESDEFQFEN